jgi:formylglycine-generating enzyme required for sulfatase activity
VGTKNPNELGIYDMSGNLWEWCSDFYGAYSSGAQTNPTGATSGNRVRRSGTFQNAASSSRVALRSSNAATYKSNTTGFRLAMDAQ